ncbi:1-acyl-sn-glycerol-3-phosphate acyltransferases [Reichenbachiella agariperforans]|uniref:1-acyl-sn-glycerol-3-phosphate acyltransferases n=1 Tax=Reichenbachiella agariperforans TaxID=156994 RepID=A0A1M6PYA2_REIAG|nr:trifunctional MMPL family transporter/lysophospholipid acyltransferase/class I SAM-dependent methyltransferase [Reichenbachiella agariperforans]SHK12881.1 1-acyl-sn-glycerol-3-phosphate acyltransferases [Reichenbachiella agariperforans]
MSLNRFLIPLLIVCIFFAGLYGLFHLQIGENLDQTLPGHDQNSSIQSWIDKQKSIVVFSLDIPINMTIDEIEPIASDLSKQIQQTALIQNIQYQNDIDPESFIQLIQDNLPIYLEEKDYTQLDSLIAPSYITQKLTDNKKTLMSPEGIGQRRQLLDDPLGFSHLALARFGQLQMTDDIIQSNGYFLIQDRSKLLIKGRATFDMANSAANRSAAHTLDSLVAQWNQTHDAHTLDYFGTFLVADENAEQIKKDVHLTVTIAVVAIILLLAYYYRKAIILVLFLVPGVFGILTAAAFIYLIQGQISGLALAASAIVFGIVADYSFHFFTHFKENGNAVKSRDETMFPLLISAGTTIVAFLSLLFADSKTLNDFGLFTSLSLAGTLFFILTALPLILRRFEKGIKFTKTNPLDRLFAKIKIGQSIPSKWSMFIFIGLTSWMLYMGIDVQFESDLRKINYYPDELQQREIALRNTHPTTEQHLTMLSVAADDHSPEWNNEQLADKLHELQNQNIIKSHFSLAPFLISKEKQQERIARWNSYWEQKRTPFLHSFQNAATQQNWKPQYFDRFYDMVENDYQTYDLNDFIASSDNLSDMTLTDEEHTEILTTVVCPIDQVDSVKQELASLSGIVLIDNMSIVTKIVDSVKDDFNFLLLYAGLAVFIAFLLIYGNIELTLVSFIPMVLSWIWVLGMASLLDVKFNFINIILTTFIFGLGDDFSIFVTDGLLHRYKYRKEVMGQYKTGIVLSSVSTIIGTGVLLFAKHPALQSIALLSIIGIGIIVPITFFIQPVLFRMLISHRTEEGKPPYSIANILFSIWGYGMFIGGSLLSVAMTFGLKMLPLSTETKKLGTHRILQKVSGFQLDILWKSKKRHIGMENLDFASPSIIIANHTSFFDILALVRLHPKMVLLVNEWVYNSPLFGPAIRYADYIPAYQNMEDQLPKLRQLVADGYTIAIFPEGKRSEDGTMGRFHKGAFYLSEELQLDITPILLYGHGYVMPKNEYYFKDSPCDTVILPRISWNDPKFGSGYRERTKKISTYYKAAFKTYIESTACLDHAYAPLLYSFYYKSPILPWYFRIKWRFEKNNYEHYHQLIGTGTKRIYDLGCGYGYLSYFLWLRNNERTVIGVDYDNEKVALAQNSYLKSDQVEFTVDKAEETSIQDADAIVLADTLHYLSPESQQQLLIKCDQGLKPGGILLIRDGISDQEEKHKWTEKSEKWSTQLIKFNKTNGALHFIKKREIEAWAEHHHYSLSIESQSDKSSNTLFILSKN